MYLQLGPYRLDLASPRLMGVLNRTPDSFSDGGRYVDIDTAVRHAVRMREEGADIIDVGGESTRPGAAEVSVQEELDRVIPVIERIASELAMPVSVDTSKPEVMRAAVASGATMINDIYGLRRPGALEEAARSSAGICLMHMQGEPRTMQDKPRYGDVTAEVGEFLAVRAHACLAAGVAHERIVVDPGFGFGKTLAHNAELLRRLPDLAALGYPVLVGLSRKSMIGSLLGGVPSEERLFGSLGAAAVAVLKGAHIVRCHDVRPTVEMLRVVSALRDGRSG